MSWLRDWIYGTEERMPVERRAVSRERQQDQPSSAEIKAALDAAEFYSVHFGGVGQDAVRRMLVAAAIVRREQAEEAEIKARVHAHLEEQRKAENKEWRELAANEDRISRGEQ